jgi:hypothetical protein
MFRKLFPLFLFIIGYSIHLIVAIRALTAIGRLSDMPVLYFFLLFFFFPVLWGGMIYILSFKVPERRRKMVGLYFALASIFPVSLLTFDHRWIVAMAAMLAIVLIGWLYPQRTNERDHT